jgi:hypothetical protein
MIFYSHLPFSLSERRAIDQLKPGISPFRAKVRAKDSSWREMVPNRIAEYIEYSLYLL